MNGELSVDTQAVLLLCGRLGQVENGGARPLTTKQYSVLARWLRDKGMRPGELLETHGRARLAELESADLRKEALEPLLDRGAALGIVTARWASRGLWVLSRGDDEYPSRFKRYLGQVAPPLLFGAGDRKLLQSGGLAMVGARDASEEDIEFAKRVAAVCANQGITVISGGARGVDLESMGAAFDGGGGAVGVLPDSLARNAVSARYREGLIAGRLALVSPFDPDARWFAYTAMERNKLIYALSDAALVVAAAAESGGTWAGALEALESGRVAVYVKLVENVESGNHKLMVRGAREFPPEPWDDLRSLFVTLAPEPTLFNAVREVPVEQGPAPSPALAEAPPAIPSHGVEAAEPDHDAYTFVLPALLAAVKQPTTEQAVGQALGLVPAQAKAWLKRACDEGVVRKLGRPVRYAAVQTPPSLFSGPEEEVPLSRRV